MLELRLGSYSMAATFAGTPTLSRRKSTWRYCFLCPPPRCQITISPWLLRPPERFFGSSKAFSGSCLVIWLLSRTVINRRDAVYGLKLFSPIAASYLLTASPLRALIASETKESQRLPSPALTNSPRTRSSFRLPRASRRLSSNRDDSLRSGRGGASCRENWRCARHRPSP